MAPDVSSGRRFWTVVGITLDCDVTDRSAPCVTDDTLKQVGAFAQLRVLKVRDVPITDAGLEHLNFVWRT